ncbi:hypothetical protein E2C01_090970 [Portunus trituberculatus]|uniref:Uncharacterized protein n=1 Tax=Portunus trituberculatus TaxID=210409 RepID=A0A5B7JMA8_PORTR|nr:hypothetical protein [Portunus trituberculatus]
MKKKEGSHWRKIHLAFDLTGKGGDGEEEEEEEEEEVKKYVEEEQEEEEEEEEGGEGGRMNEGGRHLELHGCYLSLPDKQTNVQRSRQTVKEVNKEIR